MDALYDAAIEGDVGAIARLNLVPEILHAESIKGNTKRVRFILKQFVDRNILAELDYHHQKTALIWAAYYGRTEVAAILINEAKELRPSSLYPFTSFKDYLRHPDRWLNTALHLAAERGHTPIVKLLVEADPSDPHIQNMVGKTPLYLAAEEGHNDIVEMILQTCTFPSMEGPDGSTALHATLNDALLNIHKVTQGASDVIKMMVNAVEDWTRSDQYLEKIFARTDQSGNTALQLAMEKKNVNAVKLILLRDPAYRPGPNFKRSDLMGLIFKAIDKEYSDDIIEFLSKTYKVGSEPASKDVFDLIHAIRRRDEDSVSKLLTDHKHLVTYTRDNGWTPLHYAVNHEFDSIIGAIIKAQEEVGQSFEYGNMESTPFHVAAKHGYTSTLVLLMQLWSARSSTVTAVDENGSNILHLAAAHENNKEMIQGILTHCPIEFKTQILSQQDSQGNTPLHLLFSRGCFIPELIKFNGLDTVGKNKKGWTYQDMLYYQNNIVGNQTRIKIALDQMGMHTFGSSVRPSRIKTKNLLFDEEKNKLMAEEDTKKKKELQIYRQGTNSQIVVSALITTITFTVGFTMPGGLHESGEEEGLAVFSKKAAFNTFMVLDVLALLLSACSMFIYFLESIYEDPDKVFSLHATTTGLNIVSVMLMMLIFITGTYVVLSNSLILAITICIIGSLFFLFVIIELMKFRNVRRSRTEEEG